MRSTTQRKRAAAKIRKAADADTPSRDQHDFLATAVEAGNSEPFVDYVLWSARGAETDTSRIALASLRDNLRHRLGRDDAQLALPHVQAALAAIECSEPHENIALAKSVYVQSILHGNRRTAWGIVQQMLRDGADVIDIYVDIVQEALYDIGHRWETNRITVAEEHMATGITQYVLARVYASRQPSEVVRGPAVVAGVEGELHQVGANIVADALDADGWDVRFLGTNVPPAGVLEAIAEHEATLFGVSATMLFNAPAVFSLVEQVRNRFGSRTPRILLGGAAFRWAPGMVEQMGVDGWAGDVRAALALAQEQA